MAVQLRKRQRGMSIAMLLFFGALGTATIMLGMQVVPTVTEYESIKMAAQKAAQATTAAEARAMFDKSATTGYFDSISGKDLQISVEGEKLVVRFSYQREFALFGPAYLTLKYEGTSK